MFLAVIHGENLSAQPKLRPCRNTFSFTFFFNYVYELIKKYHTDLIRYDFLMSNPIKIFFGQDCLDIINQLEL